MTFPQWIQQLIGRKPEPVPAPKGKLCCADCLRQIHRHDRYVILAARHRDCRDTRMVGQASMPAKGDQ